MNSNSRLLESILIIAFLLLVSLKASYRNSIFGKLLIIKIIRPMMLISQKLSVNFSFSKLIKASIRGIFIIIAHAKTLLCQVGIYMFD